MKLIEAKKKKKKPYMYGFGRDVRFNNTDTVHPYMMHYSAQNFEDDMKEAMAKSFNNDLMSFLSEDVETKAIKLARKFGVTTESIIDDVRKIDSKSKNTDVMKFNSVDELRQFAQHLVSQTDIKKRGVFDESAYRGIEKIFDGDDVVIYRPKNFEEMKLLGANTKWCVTVHDVWFDYKGDYTFYIIINKNINPNDNNYKIAVNVNKKNIGKVWLKDNAKRTLSTLMPLNIPIEKLVYDEKTAYNPEPGLDNFSKDYVEGINLQVANQILRGGNIDQETPDGHTGVMAMAYFDRVDLVKKFIEKGADLNKKSEVGNTALMLAASNGNVKTVEVLLGAGADPNIQDREGNTALMYASNYDYPEVVSALLNKGADKEIKNNEGRDAMELAQEYKNKEVISILSLGPQSHKSRSKKAQSNH